VTPSGSSQPKPGLQSPRASWAPLPIADPGLVAKLTSALKLPETVCSVLAIRGISDVSEAKSFLRPRLDQLQDPSTLFDGPRAAERITDAIKIGETILVHGDYDVDGICATALLTRWLRSFGGNVIPFVPHRLRDGYDFSSAGLKVATEVGAGLIITADCGTVACDSIAASRARGMDVVVTDHHTVGSELPDAFAIVNPKRAECSYPEKGLCGTAVAYKVCELVGAKLGTRLEKLHQYLDLVALATVADLVPLTGENRILVSYGLRRLADTQVLGLAALLRSSGVGNHEITAGKVGFTIAPRINAAGRVGDSADALRLLLTDDLAEARELATKLEGINRKRQDEDQRTLDEALEILAAQYDPDNDFGVVLSGDGWHPGVIGIVASRVVERIHRPVVMIALDGASGRGSARSIHGFHLYEALRECSEHLGRFGGHRQAAGLDLDRTSLPAFKEAFNRVARERLELDDMRPVFRPDLALDLSEAGLDLAHWLEYIGPHGIGNSSPLFLARGVSLEHAKLVGKKHLKGTLRKDGARLDMIGFGFADRHPPHLVGREPYDVLFRLERNEWRGGVRPQARLMDMKPAEAGS